MRNTGKHNYEFIMTKSKYLQVELSQTSIYIHYITDIVIQSKPLLKDKVTMLVETPEYGVVLSINI